MTNMLWQCFLLIVLVIKVTSSPGDAPVHRTRSNERSITVYSSIQQVQEQERKRLPSRTDEHLPRIENGSYKIVNMFHKKDPFPLTNRKGQDSNQEDIQDIVVFPGPTSASTMYVPQVPESCKKTGFCESVPNYPTDIVANVVEKLGKAIYQVDEMELPEITQRIGSPIETPLCRPFSTVVYPEAAPDRSGEWFYIVNQKNKPLQGFRVEKCKEENAPCSEIIDVPIGYYTKCKQNYIQRTMSALDRDGKPFVGQFPMPSCCVCYIVNNSTF